MQKIILWPLKVLSLGLFLGLLISSNLWAKCPPAEAYYYYLVGEQFLLQGNLVSARKALERVVRCDPKALTPQKDLLKIYIQMRQYEKAISLAQKILKESPGDKDTLFLLARAYWFQQRPLRAAETLEKLLEKDPNNAEALSILTSIYLEQNKLEKAIKVLERLAKKNPENPVIYLELARVYRKKGDFDQARKYYSKALKLEPDNLKILLEYGDFLEKIGAFKEAQKIYEEALAQNPEQFHLYEALLKLYVNSNEFEKALELINKLEELVGERPQLLFRKALLLMDLNREKEAEKALEKVLEKKPDFYAALFYLGIAKEKQGLKEEALKIYQKIPPDSEVFPLALRRIAALTRDPQKVYSLVEKALASQPDNKDLYLLAASIFDQLDACDLGLSLMKKGLSQFSEDLDFMSSYAMLLVCTGNDEEVLKVLTPLLKKYPDDPDLLNFIGYTLADLNRDLDRAEKYIKKALSKKPESGYIIDSLAWVQFRKGKYQEALKNIQKALELSPNDPIIHEHYGDILKALGRPKEACKAYEKALSFAKKKRDRERITGKIEKLCRKNSS